jgi:predicted deacylase
VADPPDKPRLHCTFRKILTGSDLSRRRLPEMSLDTGRPEPTIWLTGCAHGDEVGGMVVIHELFRRLRRGALRSGCVRAFPLMNPLGFEVGSRKISMSGEDLNRSFPGSPTGSLAERLAHLVFDTIAQSEPAIVLDLHNDWIRSIPYTLLDVPPAGADSGVMETVRDLAAETGLPIVQETAPMPRTLSSTLLNQGTPALTLELSESYVVNERQVEVGVRAVWRIMRRLSMVEDDPELEGGEIRVPPEVIGPVLHYVDEPRVSTSGVIRFRARAGQIVERGEELATVHNAFGRRLERVQASCAGLVLGISDSSVAYPGVPVIALGAFEPPAGEART